MNLGDNKRVPEKVWREEREGKKWYNYTVISKNKKLAEYSPMSL